MIHKDRHRGAVTRGARLGEMEVERIAEGLWRWSAVHPEWKPGQDWDAELWCVYAEQPDAIVLVDPLVPADDEPQFWQALDRDVERTALPVAVLVTSHWHERSAGQLGARYEATRTPPGSVRMIPVSHEEVVCWLPSHGTLVAGDALLGGPDGLRLQPPEWLDGDYPAFVEAVAGLLELPVERVLPSHGDAVVEDARAALAHAHHSAATSL
jgi:glyoxylase-like metal-dependent hydrolase (beta-lactamase superfamily II)